MIDVSQAKVGMNVVYQQTYMSTGEYGLISSLESAPEFIFVKFAGDIHTKACRPENLYWMPGFFSQEK